MVDDGKISASFHTPNFKAGTGAEHPPLIRNKGRWTIVNSSKPTQIFLYMPHLFIEVHSRYLVFVQTVVTVFLRLVAFGERLFEDRYGSIKSWLVCWHLRKINSTPLSTEHSFSSGELWGSHENKERLDSYSCAVVDIGTAKYAIIRIRLTSIGKEAIKTKPVSGTSVSPWL